MGRQIDIEERGDTLTLRQTRWGRLMAALYRAVVVFPLVMLALMVVFMPDYIFRFAEEEPVTGLFWAAFAGLALLVAGLASTMRYLRRDRWIFDGSSRMVVAEMATLWGEPGRGEADLRELESMGLMRRRWPKKSALILRLKSGREETVFSGRGMGAELESVADSIMEFLRRQRYHIELERLDDTDEEA